MRLPAFARVRNTRLNTLPYYIPLELRKHGKESCEGPSSRRGEVEGLCERDKPHTECREIMECRHEIDQRAPPAIELPDENDIEPPLSSRFEHFLALGAVALGPRGNLFERFSDHPAASSGVLAHALYLYREGLLIMGGYTSIEGSLQG